MIFRFTALAFSAALSTVAAKADGLSALGLDDPEVTAPDRTSGDWTGFYAGLSYGRSETSESRPTFAQRCYKLFEGVRFVYPGEDGPRLLDCDDETFTFWGAEAETVDVPTGTITETAKTDSLGAFAGYRHDFGRIVGGVEIGVMDDQTTAEVQLGLDLGPVLAYGLAGSGDGMIWGVGADVQIGKRLMVGAKVTDGDAGRVATIRVGIRF